ncbi:MAG: tRNA epoxyqueuosine(34) reductase QueG [Alphaproteobacteria bacterium]|nr:MAG: tRNA epoxyqueuosine(34) reductase QueG [Alphaproteobacteria bacterium]
MTSTSKSWTELGEDQVADLTKELYARIDQEGFAQVGIMSTDDMPDISARLADFVADDWHGDMDWLARNLDRRASPKGLWPEANSVIVVGMNYGPGSDPRALQQATDHGAISCYAQNKDYHDVIKKRIRRIARWLAETTGADVKIFVDTAPVPEKALAQMAGIGWQGKHTNLVSREKGSWLLLGSIYTELKLPPSKPETDHCGGCHRCMDVCPTDAFPAPYKLDARKCISYLTIEHKGPIPKALRPAMGNRIYGCDDCLAVCPWNKFAQASTEAAFHPREELKLPLLIELATFDDAGFRQYFSGSPIKRIGRDRFTRNVLIALGNSDNPDALPTIETLLADISPLVRGAAVWAARQLADSAKLDSIRRSFQPQERDPQVLEEWSPLV